MNVFDAVELPPLLEVRTQDGEVVERYGSIKQLIADIKSDMFFDNGNDVCVITYDNGRIVGSITTYDEKCIMVLMGQVTVHTQS